MVSAKTTTNTANISCPILQISPVLCGTQFMNKADLLEHESLHRIEARQKHNFSNIRINEFGDIEDTDSDNESEYVPTYEEEECETEDNQVKKTLKQYDNEKMLAEEDYPCDKCERTFFYKTDLNNHISEDHNKQKLEKQISPVSR